MNRLSNEGEGGMDEETVKQWLDQMHRKDKIGSLFQIELGRALEANDPVAEDFLRKATKLQPDYIKGSSLREHAERLRRQDELSGKDTT